MMSTGWTKAMAATLATIVLMSCDPLQPLANISEQPSPSAISTSLSNLAFTAFADTQTVSVYVMSSAGDTIQDAEIVLTLDGQSVDINSVTISDGGFGLRVTAVENGDATISVSAGDVTRSITASVRQALAALELSDTLVTFSSVGQTAWVDARPVDANGFVIASPQKTWESDDPSIVTVNSDGTLTSMGNGTTTVRVSVEDVTRTLRVVVSQNIDQIVLSAGGGQSAPVATAVATAPSVIVLDDEGNPVAGTLVSFTTASGGGIVQPAAAIVTDEQGVAAVTSWTLGPVVGINTLIATAVMAPQAAVTITATGIAGAANAIAINNGNNQTAAAGTSLLVPPTVIVTDAFGNPVAGEAVTFAPAPGSGQVTPTTAIVTDANGIAAVSSWTLGTSTGLQFLIATADNTELSGNPVTFLATASTGIASNIAIHAGNSQSTVVGEQLAVPPAVIVTDGNGNPVSQVLVSFNVTAGGGTVSPTTSVATDAQGIASLDSWTVGSEPGPNALTATAVGVAGAQVEFIATATVGAPASITPASIGQQTGAAGTEVPMAPSVLVTDASGNPVAGALVTFSVTVGGGSVDPVGPIAADADGIASLNSWVLGTVAGQNEVRASVPNVTGDVAFTAVGMAGPPTSIEVVGGDQQTAIAGNAVNTPPSTRVVDQFGNPVGGVSVNYAVTGGGGSINPTGALQTNGDGITQLSSWTLGTEVGSNTLSARAVGVAVGVTFNATGTSGPPAAIQIVSGNNQTAVVAQPVPIPPSVRIIDTNGNPVEGTAVSFAVTGGGGTVDPTTSINTDANGVANATSWTLGTAAGENTLNASAAGVSGAVSFTATGTPGPPGVIQIVTQPSGTAASGVALAQQPVVQIQDDVGNPILQDGVDIVATIASGGGSLTGVVATTDVQGTATFTNLTISGTVGPRTLSFVSAGYVPPESDVVNLQAGAASQLSIVDGNNQTATAGTPVAVPPSARVTDASDNPVAGVSVTFSVTAGGGTIQPTGAINTDANGIAALQSWTLGATVGVQTLSAVAAGVTGEVSFLATSTVGPAETMAINAGDGQTAPVGTAVTVAPSVIVTDAAGNPVAGVSVNFAVSVGGGSVTPTSAVTTNALGIAAVTSWTLGSTPGPNTLTATAVGVASRVAFQATGTSGSPTNISINGGNGQIAIAGTNVSVPPSVLVTDQLGNPISGVEVKFGVTAGGGTIDPLTVIPTDASGIASLTSWTLGTSAGVNTLVATAAGVTGNATFTATGTAGPAAVISIEAGDGQTAPVNTPVATPPSVRVTDVNGNAVQGATVNFAVSTGGGTIDPASAVTDASGVAAANSWVLGPTPGSNTIVASAVGVSGSLTFTATGTTGQPTTITVSGGQNQTAQAGSAVPVPPSVLVTDAGGNPVAGVGVTFAVTAGGGSVSPTTAITTGADGIATVTSWTLGAAAGANTLTASSAAIPGVTADVNATATAPAPIVLEQSVEADDKTQTLTLPSMNGGTNQTYVLFVATKDNEDITGVTGGGLVWTEHIEQCGGDDQTGLRLYTAQGSPTSAFQVVIDVDKNIETNAVLARYSGVISVEGAASTNDAGGNCSESGDSEEATLTLTSTVGGSIHLVGIAPDDEELDEVSSGYSNVGSADADDDDKSRLFVFQRLFSSPTTNTLTGEFDDETEWATAGIVLRQ